MLRPVPKLQCTHSRGAISEQLGCRSVDARPLWDTWCSGLPALPQDRVPGPHMTLESYALASALTAAALRRERRSRLSDSPLGTAWPPLLLVRPGPPHLAQASSELSTRLPHRGRPQPGWSGTRLPRSTRLRGLLWAPATVASAPLVVPPALWGPLGRPPAPAVRMLLPGGGSPSALGSWPPTPFCRGARCSEGPLGLLFSFP